MVSILSTLSMKNFEKFLINLMYPDSLVCIQGTLALRVIHGLQKRLYNRMRGIQEC